MTAEGDTIRLTADVVALGPGPGRGVVLLIRRARDPHAGRWALPGGHVDAGETALEAARRELEEETGVAATRLVELGTWHAPGRDPRGRYVTVAHVARLREAVLATAGDDAAEARWWPVDEALREGLAFDHGEILRAALR